MSMVGQAVAALLVAGLASVPLLLHANAGPARSRGVLAGLIGLFAFGAARHHGGSFGRAAAYALVVVAIALAVAIGKYLITGH
jgi:ABC-type sugar transport system permease subunit